MSRGQRPRTPANFPRMKHRAAGRLQRKRGRGKMTLPEAIGVFTAIGKFINDGVDALIYAFEGIARAFSPPPTRADFVLSPGIPDGLLRDPEGRALVEKIHERKQRVIGPEDWPTETELQADLTRTKTGRPE